MKFSLLLYASVLICLLNIQTEAQIILAPGEQKLLTNDPATGGRAGNNGKEYFELNSNYDVSSKIIKAEAIITNVLGSGAGVATASIYYEFTIAETPETHNNTVGAWISYNVLWAGSQHLVSLLESNTLVKVEIRLKSPTADQLILNEIIHELDLKTFSYKIITAGSNINDSDIDVNTFPVILNRGHNYKLTLELNATAFQTGSGPVHCDYMDNSQFGDGGGGVELANLFIKVGLDEKEILATVDSLEYKLEHHFHNYLTGRGAGHNNTEANTTLSIFEAGIKSETTPPLDYKSQENFIPDEKTKSNSIPDDYSVGQNYPNPFNPSTNISFAIPTQELVTIKVFDILGRQVAILMNEIKVPGYYEVKFNAERLSSGTYIYEIRAGSFVETKKMVLMK